MVTLVKMGCLWLMLLLMVYNISNIDWILTLVRENKPLTTTRRPEQCIYVFMKYLININYSVFVGGKINSRACTCHIADNTLYGNKWLLMDGCWILDIFFFFLLFERGNIFTVCIGLQFSIKITSHIVRK